MCYHYYSSSTSLKEWIFLIVGAILGLFISLMWKYLSDLWFGIIVLKPRIGEYKITLKNGQTFMKMERACIKKVSGRKMTVVVETKSEEHGDADGEIEFISKNYGKGFYKNRKSDLYGFYEFVLLPNNKISVLRKYTTDKKSEERKHSEAVETSFIWEKQKSTCDWC